MSRENVRAFVAEAPEMTPRDTWPKPDIRLVNDDRPLAPKLDADALPAGWETWITTEAAARACPPDYVAAGLIGAASAWIGNVRRIAGTATWIEPPHLWFALIGAPSTGKTPALRPMKNASRKLEHDAELKWRDALASYERDAEVASAAEKLWREQVGKATKDKSTPPDWPKAAETPKKPPRPRVATMDTSTEELQQLLADNARGLLHLRDELAGWLGSFDRYGGKGSDRGFYLECWNGDDYVSDRVKFNGIPLRIKHAALAIVGGMVPDRLREALSDADDGLPARFIFIWPEPVPIASLNECSATDAAERRYMLEKAARRLQTLKMGSDDHYEPTPVAMRLDVDAFALFDEQRQEAMHRGRAACGLAGEWHGKNPGRLLRLALVFELLASAAGNGEAPEPQSVSADAIVRAGGFIDYAAAMFERVIAGLAVSRAEANAAQIARHVMTTARAAPPHAPLKLLNERDLYQRAGFSWARNKEFRAEALAVMSEAAWLRRPQADGHGRPRGDWEVNPRLVEAER
jgi:uncharacterized protein DUF3987